MKMNPREFQKVYKVPDKTNTFCYYPFYALVFKMYNNSELSHIAPCCMMHDTDHNSILNKEELKGLTPDQIFNHEKFQKLRDNLMNGVKDKHCATCWNQENQGKISHRMYTGWDFDEPFVPSLKEVDLSLSNKCNLACRMCNIGNSHRLYDDIDKMEKLGVMEQFNLASDNSMISNNLPKNTSENIAIKWLYKNTEKIKILKISGGEPLYDKSVIKLLNKFVEDGSSEQTSLVFHTNGLLIDDQIIDLLNKFKHQMHTFSIDGVDKTYEYVRHLSNFQKLERNLINWFSKSKNIKYFNSNFVLSALNIHNIVDYMNWIVFNFHNKIKCNIFFSSVRPFTRGIHISNLPINYLKKIKNEFLIFYEFFEKIRQKDMSLLNHFYYESENIIKMIDNSIDKNLYDLNKNKLYDEISILDKVRNQHYSNYLPEDFCEILNKIKNES